MRGLILAAAMLLPVAALAADPAPAIDMTQVLLDQHGKPFVDPTQATKDDPNCAKCGDLRLGTAIATSLCTDTRETANQPALAKFKDCSLGERLEHDKAAHLTAAEVTQIEARLNTWSPAVLVRIIPLIDPNAAK